jgi:4-hydroxy-3-methylbut-2-enyl diphosphate reductase
LERERLSTSDVARGEVVVASTFRHPVRGTVSCPAAPVVRAALRASDLQVRQRPISAGGGAAVLHAVSYVDPDGQVIGLGIAAHSDDMHAVRLAEKVVREWSRAMRTRRVLLEATGPSCTGLRREAALLARISGQAYVLAAGRRDVPSQWPWRDVRLVERLADVPDDATIVLPAHGVDSRTTAEARAAAADRQIAIVDATCPLVERAHATARRFADEKDTVVVIGGAGHVAVPALAGQVPASVVVTSAEDIDDLVVDSPAQVAYVVSPGLPVEDADAFAARLRSRFPGTIGQHPDELCYAASDRRAAVRAVASCSQLTLVLGDRGSADTRELAGTAAEVGGRVERLDDLCRLRPDWLEQAGSIGVLVGASARPDLAGELIGVLSGLGPLSVTRRHVATEVESTSTVAASTRRAG